MLTVLNRMVSRVELCKAVRSSVNEYHRQYTGFVVGDQRVIDVNAFNGSPGSDSRSEPFSICDGGSSGWGATYYVVDWRFPPVVRNGLA